MEWYFIPALIFAGFLCGFINVLAGSGSLISLPLLMFMGLPANVANGTNRIAILLQNVVGVTSFKQQKVFKLNEGIWLAIPAVVGSLIGAALAINMNDVIMTRVIGGLLVFMFFIILFKPDAWIKGQAGIIQSKPSWWQILIFFGIGLYGGFIQAGVGFFLLAGLVLGAGFDLVKANAIKLLIVLIYTPFALAVFIYTDQVNWKAGLILGVGNMLGAYVASRYAVSWGAKVVRIILLVIVMAASVKLLLFP